MPLSASRSSTSIAQTEAEGQPDRVLDDLSQEAMAALADVEHSLFDRRFAMLKLP